MNITLNDGPSVPITSLLVLFFYLILDYRLAFRNSRSLPFWLAFVEA